MIKLLSRQGQMAGLPLTMLLIAAVSFPASAQEPEAQAAEAPSRGAPADEGFQQQLRAALMEFNAGNFEEARGLMTKAHRLKPSARTLRGLGMIEFELRNYASSAEYLAEALASTERPLTDVQRAEVQGLLARAKGFVARVLVSLEPASARLLVDGIPATGGGELALEVGDHILEARANGYVAEKRQLKVAGGESLSVSFALQLLRPSQAALPASDGDRGPAVMQRSDGPGAMPWVVIAVSGAVAVTGGVLLGVAQGDVGSVENASDGTRWSEVSDAHDRAPTLSTAGGIMLGVGVAGAAAGLLWHFGAFGAGERTTGTAIHVGPGAISVSHRM